MLEGGADFLPALNDIMHIFSFEHRESEFSKLGIFYEKSPKMVTLQTLKDDFSNL